MVDYNNNDYKKPRLLACNIATHNQVTLFVKRSLDCT